MIARCVGNHQIKRGPVRIDPGMQFHTTFVGFVDRKFQRVVKRLRRLPRFTGQETAPRFATFGIERIGGRPYLQEDGIDARTLMVVQVPNELLLLLGRTQVTCRGPVDVDHRGNPSSPKLPLWKFITKGTRSAIPYGSDK